MTKYDIIGLISSKRVPTYLRRATKNGMPAGIDYIFIFAGMGNTSYDKMRNHWLDKIHTDSCISATCNKS